MKSQSILKCKCGKEFFSRSAVDTHVHKLNRPLPHLKAEIGKHERIPGTFYRNVDVLGETIPDARQA
jgi:hypothetical protein